MEPTHIFLFYDLYFNDIFDGFSDIHGYLTGKIKNLGWYSWNLKKQKIETSLRHPAGPSGLRSGPRAQWGAWEVSIYFLSGFMKPPKDSIFLAKNIRETS